VSAATVEAGGLLLVHAHPDDECFSTGGLIARSVAEGRRVDLVVCTGGEEGEVHDPDLDPEEARHRLGEIRAAELECSVGILRGSGPGEMHLHRLGYRDSGMVDSEANAHAESFWQADFDEATGRLVAIIRAARPAVLVTYDANGMYGHPDHIQAHRVAVAAMQAAADPSRYPDAGPAHAMDKFYEIAINRDRWVALLTTMHQRGIPLPWDFDIDALSGAAEELNPTNAEAARQVVEQLEAGEDPPAFGTPESAITAAVDVSPYLAQKRAGMACHRTQLQDFGWMLSLPEDLVPGALSPESFVLTRWPARGVREGLRESSLFEGLG
jgi:LmbE family N-acetylglucosaminyl deacetylase